VCGVGSNAITAGLIIYFVLCGLRAVVRLDWLAALVGAVLLSLQEGSVRASANLYLDVPIFVAIFGIFAFMLLRMGLVAAITALFVINLTSSIPFGAEIRSWTTPTAVFLMLVVVSVPLYGYWRSQAPGDIRA
jgi:hypothetical protein